MLDSLRLKSLDAHDALLDVLVDQCRHQIWTNWTPVAAGGPKVSFSIIGHVAAQVRVPLVGPHATEEESAASFSCACGV